MKTIFLTFCLTVLSFSLFAEPTMTLNSEVYTVPKDLFEDELDTYRANMDNNSTWMLWSGASIVAGFLLSSASVTLTNMEILDKDFGNIMTYGSYGLIGISGAGFFFSTRGWKKNTEYYYDSLRLKSQYYNLVK